jgi:hypothetical protein
MRPRPVAAVLAALFAGASLAARAQDVDAERSRTLVVGTPAGARTDRVDGARSGLARSRLPASGLRIQWRAPAGAPLDQGPLVDAHGNTYAVAVRGDAVAVGPDGVERWRIPTGALGPGPAALLSDDTLAFVDGAGIAVAVRAGAVRWRTKIGAPDPERPAPLPMADGGVVVATSRELALLDADGHERAHATLPEPPVGPLVAAQGRVVVVAASGSVWGWSPGAPEPVRIATLGSAPDGGPALADDHTLLVVDGGRTTLAAVDLLRGTTSARAVGTGGAWMGPPAMRGDVATVLFAGPASTLAVSVDGAGREVSRAVLLARPALARDAGAPLPGAEAGPLLVDATATLVFALPDGGVGATLMGGGGAGPDSAVEILSEACPRLGGLAASAHIEPPVAGLAPLANGSFVAACRSGTLVAVSGQPAVRQPSGRPGPGAL